ncbi:hypothetical protein ILUMI_25920 [Ignelater luminosus]|uniref:Uncharacterized protein n=1 Tax=Ignelater luminosus TaxID=2038154 RepID=A0A8K0FZG3_IGNLU|nr:hypothetical protein ILUMI_25920 [Ignelater luminosus]
MYGFLLLHLGLANTERPRAGVTYLVSNFIPVIAYSPNKERVETKDEFYEALQRKLDDAKRKLISLGDLNSRKEYFMDLLRIGENAQLVEENQELTTDPVTKKMMRAALEKIKFGKAAGQQRC